MSEEQKGKPEAEELEDSALDQISGGLGSVSSTPTSRSYEAWPCKWYVPELDSDSSAMIKKG
jgi:hypothetical protein